MKRLLSIRQVFWWGFLTLFIWSGAAAAGPTMVEKNLFSPDRRPDEGGEEEGPKDQRARLPRGQIQLDGVFIYGSVKKAVLRVNPSLYRETRKKSPFVTLKEGEMIGDTGDYRLARIEGKKDDCDPQEGGCGPYIHVNYRGEDYEIALFAEGKVAPPPAPVPSAPEVQTPPGGGQQQGEPQQEGQGLQEGQANANTPPAVIERIKKLQEKRQKAVAGSQPGSQMPPSPPSPGESGEPGNPNAAQNPDPNNSGKTSSFVPPGVSLFDQMKKAIEDARQKGLIK